MTKIRLYDHPFAAVAPQLFEVASLGAWLLDHYGAVPRVNIQIFTGEPSAENEITGDLAAIVAGSDGEYVILESPGVPVWAYFVIAAVFAVAAYVLVPKPVMPGNVNRTQESPNNALGSRENKVRLLERVEDIYGTVKSIPSLLMPTYNKYIENKKYEYGYYCVGRGYYDVDELRDGDTLIDDIRGASAAVYAPFTSPNSGAAAQLQVGDAIIDEVVTVRRAIEVDGITLKATNQVDLPNAPARYSFFESGQIKQNDKTPNFNSIVEVGDEVIVNATSDTGYSFSGTYPVTQVGDGFIYVDAVWDQGASSVMGTVTMPMPAEEVDLGWITLPDKDRAQVWCNIVAVNGLFKDDGGKSACTVTFAIFIEKLNASLQPTGIVETVTGAMTGAESDEVADTVEHATAWIGPARVRMERTSEHDYVFEGTVQDEIKWTDLYSVTPVTKAEFGNKTTIHTVTQATARATAVKSRQLNCLVSRRLPAFNGATFSGAFDAAGRHVSGSIVATSRLVDIIAAVSIDPKIGARDLATEVDIAQIWGVQQLLDGWNEECGQFNYTFDSDNTSFEETLVTIANAGFCTPYRQNGKIRLALDRIQPASTALFTHRNKKPRAETVTRNFASDADYDGVEFVYVDPDSNQSETIKLPLDGAYTKLKKFEIAGIRSFDQAWLRANREYFKIRGQRINIETTTTMDARALLPNARIDIVDNTRFKSYDGEVVGQDGLTLTLSQDVAFTPGQSHSIVLMRRDGSLQSIPVNAGPDVNQVVLQALPAEAIETRGGVAGIRTIFSFAADSARGAMAYLVQELDMSDGQYVTLRAVNYSPDYYKMDYAAVPARDSVIN